LRNEQPATPTPEEIEGLSPSELYQRYGIDRRDRPTPMVSRYTFRGRRKRARRATESGRGYYVDRYSTFEIVSVLVLIVLTITDALATLHILGKGGTELNPVMRSALEVGNGYFLFSKLGISFVGGVLILLHTRFPGVRKALWGLLALYGAVVVYHGILIIRAVREATAI
jgi:hypothetical protein